MSFPFASRSTNSIADADVWGIYHENVGYSAAVSPTPEAGTNAVSDFLPWIHCCGPLRVAAPSLLVGTESLGALGGLNSHWFGSFSPRALLGLN